MVWDSSYGTPDAQTYCANLDADQVEQSSAQGVWKLPTLPVLMQGLTDQFVTSPSLLGGFQNYHYHYNGYWSSTPYAADPGRALGAIGDYGYIGAGSLGYYESSSVLVRCVH